MKKLTILLILLAITLVSKAQTVYPVRTYTVLTPPMPYTLSGFASEPGRMQLNINVDDVSLESYAVYFRLVIKGNGIKLHTKPTMYQEPFYLDGGMHEVLTGMDLEPLFNPKNLLFEGYSLREYERTGRLPEGVYQISVELWDYYHKINISQAMPGVAVMYLTRAPRLTFPTKDAEVDLISNPTLRFSWMGSIPNDPQTDPVYRFSLYEIRPEGRNPYEVVKVSPPIFTEDTKQPYLLYDMGMPPLENGMEYAWQVQSVDLEERARFQNDGLSEVYNFSYGQSCETPEVQITGVTTTTVQLKLSNNPNIQLYRVFYKTTDEQDWKSTETDVPTITLSGLKENSGYEIKVTALCGGEESDESNPVRCKTNLDVDYTCGKTPNNFDVSNTEPLQELHRFDFFKAADFSIEVIEAEGSNGRFSGKGLALVPYLGFVKFMVEFENIFINADRRMTEGSVQFIYDEESGMVVNLGKILNNDDDDDDENVVDADKSVEASTDVEIKVDGEITNIQISDSTVTVKTDSGKTETITVNKGQTVGITTEEGKTVYVADTGSGEVFTAPNPKRNKAKTSSVGTSAQTGEYGTTALFKPAKQQKYGFDAVPKSSNKKPDSYFNTNKSRDKIAWKSLATGRTDYLDVQIKGKSSDTLRYIRSSGMLAPFNKSKLGDQLLLTGIPEGEEETLIAASIKKERIDSSKVNEILTEVGAIGLVSYQPIQKDVVLVSLNGAQCPTGTGAIKTALDKIYSPAIVSWNVKIDQHFTFNGLSSESFKTSGTGMFSKYTSDMSRVVKAYKKDRGVQQGTYYLFFVDEPQTNKQGFMPLTGQYGFIFNFGHNTNVLAHELAHGAFNLRHTFSSKAQHYFPERTTQNLMDYANGEELWKYQWDLIHDPEKVTLALFQDDEEGMYYAKTSEDTWAGNLNKIICAKYQGESTVELDGIHPQLQGGCSFADLGRVEINIPEMAASEKDNQIDITSREEQGSGILFHSKSRKYRVYFNIPSDKKNDLINLLDNAGDEYFTSLANALPDEDDKESQDAYSQLTRLPVCAYNKITTENIIRYLGWLSGESWTNGDQEEIIIDLLKNSSDRKGLYEALRDDPYLLASTVMACDDENRTACINEIVQLCDENWSGFVEAKGIVHLGKVSDKFNEFYRGRHFVTYAKIEGGKKECELVNYIGRFPKGMFDWGNVQELKKVSSFNVNLLDPVKIYSSVKDQCGLFPAIFALNVSQELGTSEVTDQFANTLNYIGVGSAVKMLQVGNKLQKTLALTEIIKTGLDEVFNEPSVIAAIEKEEGGREFLKYYNIVSIGVDIATIGADVLDGIVNNGAKASKAARSARKTEAADNIDDLVEEARALRKQGGATVVIKKVYSNLEDALKSNIDNVENYLYRGDTREVEDIFEHGFTARGSNTDLFDYVEHNTPSIYIGTTKKPSVTTDKFLKDKEGYVYIVDKKGTMTDVNNYYSAMGDVNIYSDEFEVVIENLIPSSQIKGAFKIDINGNVIDDLIPNPNYIP